jgi:hypothetical protein|tara:strand:+ start:98 stop:502 length:405 start_codon:yes stop_codon:yes gene_type:complete
MSKKVDVVVNRGIHKTPKGPSKSRPRETFGKHSMTPEQVDHVCETYNVEVKNNCFVMGPPKNDGERMINQANYWIANGNQVKARENLKAINFTSKMIKAYINDELEVQKEHPEESGYLQFKDKPMPEEFRVRGN